MKKVFYYVSLPLTFLAAHWFKYLRKGYKSLPVNHKKLSNQIGVYPILDHYYDPFYNVDLINKEKYNSFLLFENLAYNIEREHQLYTTFYNKFYNDFKADYNDLLTEVRGYGLSTDNFSGLDAFAYYALILEKRPPVILEIGSGISTLVALKAISKVQVENPTYQPKFYCVEPYEMKWLETKKTVTVIRKTLEESLAEVLNVFEENMFLFIDSSHIIKPQSDLIYIFSNLLPKVPAHSFVHFHDIYLPYDYPFQLLEDANIFSNEQYLLGAFLTNNDQFEIVLSNYFLAKTRHISLDINPGFIPKSMWLYRNKYA